MKGSIILIKGSIIYCILVALTAIIHYITGVNFIFGFSKAFTLLVFITMALGLYFEVNQVKAGSLLFKTGLVLLIPIDVIVFCISFPVLFILEIYNTFMRGGD